MRCAVTAPARKSLPRSASTTWFCCPIHAIRRSAFQATASRSSKSARSRPRSRMSTFLLVEARFYPHLNDMLLEGARRAIEAAGHKHEVLTGPGALELPGAIALAARSGRFCAFVALGVVIRGETYHFEVVSNESARGLMDLTLQGFAIGNGVLTVEDEQQAIVRADPDQGDKGGHAARAALALYDLREKYAP